MDSGHDVFDGVGVWDGDREEPSLPVRMDNIAEAVRSLGSAIGKGIGSAFRNLTRSLGKMVRSREVAIRRSRGEVWTVRQERAYVLGPVAYRMAQVALLEDVRRQCAGHRRRQVRRRK